MCPLHIWDFFLSLNSSGSKRPRHLLKYRRVALAWLTLSSVAVSFYPVGCGARLKTESVCGERRSNLSICSGDLFSVKGLKQMVHNKQRNIKR